MTENATALTEPDFTLPNVYAILYVLAEAGPSGLQAGEIARFFDGPPPRRDIRQHDSPRNRWCNTALRSQLGQGWVRRSEHKEPSLIYNNVPAWRWYITDAGLDRVAQGPLPVRAEARRHRLEQASAELHESYDQRQRIASQAIADGYGPHTPRCQWRPKILELRSQQLTLDEIGLIFGVTREYIRLIEAGRGAPCRCPLHPQPEGGRGMRRKGPQNWPRKRGVRLPKPGTFGELMASWADVDEPPAV